MPSVLKDTNNLLEAATCNLSTTGHSKNWVVSESIKPCFWSRISRFDYEEKQFLYQTYTILYLPHQLPDINSTAITYHQHESVTIGDERYMSQMVKRTGRCRVILASWAGCNGEVDQEHFVLRLGKVLFYVRHSIEIDGHEHEHLFACVKWYIHCPQIPSFFPLSYWQQGIFEEGGPSTFMPVQRIHSRRVLMQCQQDGQRVLTICPLLRKDLI